MVPLTRLLAGAPGESDGIRFGTPRGPVVVWHLTPRCSLHCRHCYAEIPTEAPPFSRKECAALLASLRDLGSPMVLLSGGEPLAHPFLEDILGCGKAWGLPMALSTNGVGIDAPWARKIRDAGVVYAGVSLDGDERTHDAFRGVSGAYRRAREGLRHLREAGVPVGLRFTLARSTLAGLGALFETAREEGVRRVCLYHAVPIGRGSALGAEILSRGEARRVLERLFEEAERLAPEGVEVLTVDNASDGPYGVGLLSRVSEARAQGARELLRRVGGNRSGEKIISVRWDGMIFPDQFSWTYPLGSCRRDGVAQIWRDAPGELLTGLRGRKDRITGRCARCGWFDCCNGNLRARAAAMTGDFWASDPGCVLEDEELEVRA